MCNNDLNICSTGNNTNRKTIIMNKLIWRMYNENRISLEVAEELLDCYYNRTNKVY